MQMKDLEFFRDLDREIQRQGVDPTLIEVEITEGVVVGRRKACALRCAAWAKWGSVSPSTTSEPAIPPSPT